ncbi:hypothetical protein CKO38_12410 [Rhodospirillum rubrum]|uniref:DUF485 domain-containing protein n=1 Tax=Rhodospirillum rubrum TaxID=1085 RepID=UPI00190386E3|nr:DUF485 domain-containing protein [Rhodospirillum rubrum]MBK1665382.1 hypothetical protein [Rhodospirillum rubrum]MBK1677453.1 hypothetical protein [Rhodospirillum rubrum]
MSRNVYDRVRANPKFHELCAKRGRFAWSLAIVMLVIYYGFVMIVAFWPTWLGTPLSSGSVTTIGIPIGLGVILSAFILTGIYVRRANGEFDELTRQIVEESK